MKLLKQKKSILSLILVTLILSTVVTVIAQRFRYPTFSYYGQMLSADEYLNLIETGISLSCTQFPSIESYLFGDRSAVVTDFACFNTLDEVYAYNDKVIMPEWARIAVAYPNHQRLEAP